MDVVTSVSVARYRQDDVLDDLLDRHSRPADERLTTQRWLRSDAAKRAVTWAVYGELLATEGLRVLDIGAGLSALQRLLAARHDYIAIDLLAHETVETAETFVASAPGLDLRVTDWAGVDADDVGEVDIIVTNDLFPNVDQRLIGFLDWASGLGHRMIASLTYFATPRAYAARRVDGDEILHVASWNAGQIQACDGVAGWHGLSFDDSDSPYPASVFANGRNVAVASLERQAS